MNWSFLCLPFSYSIPPTFNHSHLCQARFICIILSFHRFFLINFFQKYVGKSRVWSKWSFKLGRSEQCITYIGIVIVVCLCFACFRPPVRPVATTSSPTSLDVSSGHSVWKKKMDFWPPASGILLLGGRIFGVIEVLVTVSHLKFAFNPTLKGVRLSDMMPSELEPSNSSFHVRAILIIQTVW